MRDLTLSFVIVVIRVFISDLTIKIEPDDTEIVASSETELTANGFREQR